MSKYIVAVLGCTVAAGLCAAPAVAQQTAPQPLPPVEVQQKKPKPVKRPAQNQVPAEAVQHERHEAEPSLAAAPAGSSTLTGEAIASQKPATNDTAQLLSGVPGVSLYQAGGVSSLPVIHGLSDDQLRVEVNGMLISAACPNHMNPAMSYIDPAAVAQVKVMAGITPVSAGGDSIGGTILVESAAPRFALGDGVITYGTASVFGRSNGDGISASGSVSAATNNINITYTGSWSRSGDYKDGNGSTVEATLYESENHMLSVAVRDNSNLLVIQGGVQHIPYEGFVNQYMDMTGNDAWFLNGHYEGRFDWGKLDLRAFFQDTRHEMNLTSEGDKQLYMNNFPMPMNTHGQNFGYAAKAEIPESPGDMLRVGNELHGFLLNDWWPPVLGSGPGMCCNTFWNINGGQRYDVGTFVEWEKKWDRQWTTLLGARNDVVWMDTGNVQGYSLANIFGNPSGYSVDAKAFNAQDRARTDVNFDATALTRYEPDSTATYEGGFSMKTRSPDLYQRYAWSTNGMAAMMNGAYGDGNYYVGNLDLKPETANTLSVTTGWHDSARQDWELKITPYYSYVDDYIDVNRCSIPNAGNAGNSTCNSVLASQAYKNNQSATAGYVELQFANHNAQIYGADISGRMTLLRSEDYGKLALLGVVGYVRGTNLDTGDNLYHMMPLNAKLTLEHKLGNWSNAAELQLVDAKTDVEQVRDELQTPGYALVNLRSSYQWGQVRFDAGVENLFNQQYYSPLGGDYLGDAAIGSKGPTPVAGMGRTVYAGITVKF